MFKIFEAAYKNAGKYILIVEDSTPTKNEGIYCILDETKEGKLINLLKWVKKLAPQAAAMITVGI